MKTKHTPKPWRIETENETGNPTISIRDGLNQQIATVNPYRLAMRDADACLIAAAPELLDALLETLSCIDQHTDDPVIGPIIEGAMQAIAKARGERP